MCVCVHPVIDASMVLQAAFYVYIHPVYSPLQPMSCPANLLAHSQHHPQTWRENIFGKNTRTANEPLKLYIYVYIFICILLCIYII